MCKAIENANQLLEIMDGLTGRETLLQKRLGVLDKAQDDMLHMIENEDKINVVRGYDLCKAMKNIREERRNVKDELKVMQSLIPKISPMKNNILIAINRAKSIDTKSDYLHKSKSYSPKQINFNNDIRIEIKKLIEGVV